MYSYKISENEPLFLSRKTNKITKAKGIIYIQTESIDICMKVKGILKRVKYF